MKKSKVWPGTRAKIYARDGMKCVYCNCDCVDAKDNPSRKMVGVATLDHVIPLSRGGSNAFENLVTSCFTCNVQKNRRTREEYQEFLAERASS